MDHWPALADLPLVVEELGYGRLDPGPGFGEAHSTRLVRLTGAGHEGLGEDITLFFEPEGPTWRSPASGRSARSARTSTRSSSGRASEPEFATWSAASATGATSPRRWTSRSRRRAGRCTRCSAASRGPSSYVNSFGIGDPDVGRRCCAGSSATPGCASSSTPTWLDPRRRRRARRHRRRPRRRLQGPLRARGRGSGRAARAVRARARGLPEALSRTARPARGHRAARAARRPRLLRRADPHRRRPRRGARPGADVQHQAEPGRVAARAVRALRRRASERGLAMYGGGMGELGVARGQIQLLAAMFSPDAPNDIAPPGFNALEPAAGLPPSPLAPDPAPVGFRGTRTAEQGRESLGRQRVTRDARRIGLTSRRIAGQWRRARPSPHRSTAASSPLVARAPAAVCPPRPPDRLRAGAGRRSVAGARTGGIREPPGERAARADARNGH